jgi:predicted O-linked N-acetylglucosamine transferase (SPINDLY family)
MAQLTLQQTFDQAVQHHQAGRLREAEQLYRQVLGEKPTYTIAMHCLAVIACQTGRNDLAIDLIRHALFLDPNHADGHSNLGNLLKEKGKLEEAILAYRKAISLKPNFPEAHNNLANALRANGQLNDAIAEYRRAIELRPNFPEAHGNLGVALKESGYIDKAIGEYRQAIALKPEYAQAYFNLGISLHEQDELDEAVAAYARAGALNPNYAEAHNNRGRVLKDQGRLDDAITAYSRAISLRPAFVEAHSNLIMTLLYHPAYGAQVIAEECGRWNAQHAEPLKKFITAHNNDRDPDRRLRIGYVSPDFRDHVVGRNILPLLRHHDRRQFEIISYAQVPRADAITGLLQQNVDGWRNIAGLSDAQVAEQIRKDRIDLLVDLAFHTADNRLLVFARKPAPVQVTWLGCPASTGLTAIDYRLSDPYLDPPGMDESIFSERTIRLPDSFWCYGPPDGRDIPVNSLPALDRGFVTFGCLSTFAKINDAALSLWAKVMHQVQDSRLLLLAPVGSPRQRTLDRLAQEGIDPGRIEFVPRQSRQKYLELYHRIDLGLDSFPYNGHNTSLDSFLMGVPVITRVGQKTVSRAGWSQLSNLGLGELAGHSDDQFVRIAVELARDLPRLQELRSTLRRRLEQSPLMDAQRFARNIEAAYRQIWRQWVATGK